MSLLVFYLTNTSPDIGSGYEGLRTLELKKSGGPDIKGPYRASRIPWTAYVLLLPALSGVLMTQRWGSQQGVVPTFLWSVNLSYALSTMDVPNQHGPDFLNDIKSQGVSGEFLALPSYSR